MNPLQFAQQIKHELESVVWAEGAGDVVFGSRGSVLVYAGSPTESQIPPGFPVALVTFEGGSMDTDEPRLIEQSFGVIVMAEVAGGAMGEFAVIGGARPDLGRSAGAGVAEVSERARAAIQDLNGSDGARVILSASSTTAPQTLTEGGRHMAFDELGVTAFCTSQPTFVPPQRLAVTGDAWTWEGDHCARRFDFLQYRLAYNMGTTPPETPEGADGIVYTGEAPSTTHSVGSGRAYSIFADYASRRTVPERSSNGAEVGAYVLT